MKAKLLKASGEVMEIEPKNGTDFTLDEPYKHLNCSLVEEDGEEDCFPICANGRCLTYKDYCLDLFFAPNKKVGWMNLYKKDFGLVQGDLVRSSEEAAKEIAAGDEDYITTIKVEWEE